MQRRHAVPTGNDRNPERFEDLLAKLESSVSQLEEGKLPLDDALKLYVNAVEIYRRCRSLLEDAQGRIEVLLEDVSGEKHAEPFHLEEEQEAPEETTDDTD